MRDWISRSKEAVKMAGRAGGSSAELSCGLLAVATLVFAQISICPPSSTTRLGGMRKNSVASSVLFDIRMKSRSRQRPRARAQPQLLASDEEGRVHQIEAKAAHSALREGAQDVRLIHETVANAHRIEGFAEFVDVEPLLVRHMRHVLGFNLHHHDTLMQDLVVLQSVEQRNGGMRQVARHENCRPRDAGRSRGLEPLDELTQRQRVAGAQIGEQAATAPPCR